MEAFIPFVTLIFGIIAGAMLTYLVVRHFIDDEKKALAAREEEVSALRTENERLVRMEARVEAEREAAQEKLKLLEEARDRLADAFKALSSDALKSNNQAFLELAKSTLGQYREGAKGDLDQRKQAIDELVKPLREALEKVDGRIRELEEKREGAYSSLREQVKGMLESQSSLKSETANLVQALRTPNVRGQWGEVQLERAVEYAGMLEYCDFVQQETASTEDGRLRPDMIVRLPNGKKIIVDAKAPLEAFLKALQAPDEDARRADLQTHARHIRDHLSKLGAKNYWRQFEPTPEFVVLFLPGEAFFSAALEADASLIEYGSNERVILATPTTLIAMLKAVSYGWKQEQIAEEARRIGELGREVYERMGVLATHFSSIGRHLEGSVDAYNKAVRSTESRLLVSARKLKDMAPGKDKKVKELRPVEKQVTFPQAEELNLPESESA